MLGAVDRERGEVGFGAAELRFGADVAGARHRDGPGGRSGRRLFGLAQVFADAAQDRADPENGFGRGVDPREDRLAAQCGDEFPELGAGELQKEDGGGLGTEALQGGEGGQQGRGRRRAEIHLDLHGDGVAEGSGGEVGREQETEHEPASLQRGRRRR